MIGPRLRMERVQVAATAANTVSYIYDGGPTGTVVAAAPTQNGVSWIFEFSVGS